MRKIIIIGIIISLYNGNTSAYNRKIILEEYTTPIYNNTEIYIPQNIEINYHRINTIKYDYNTRSGENLVIDKFSGIFRVLNDKFGQNNMEILLSKNLYIIGGDIKSEIFGSEKTTTSSFNPLWYYTNFNDSIEIKNKKLIEYTHTIEINDIIQKEDGKILLYFINPTSRNLYQGNEYGLDIPKIFLFDDIMIPFNIISKYNYIPKNSDTPIQEDLKVNIKYETLNFRINPNKEEYYYVILPYLEIETPFSKSFSGNSKITLYYSMFEDVELKYGNSIEVYKNGDYLPTIKYIKY